MQNEEMLRLDEERARANELLRGLENGFVPMALAAAVAFHRARGNTNAILSRDDYDDALNIAAAALSRLVPVYQLEDPKEARSVAIDFARQRFARGATELRVKNEPACRNLCVRHADLNAAVSLVMSAGLPFVFAVAPEPAPDAVRALTEVTIAPR